MTQTHVMHDHDTTTELAAFCHDLRQYVGAGLLLTQMPDDELLDEFVRRRLSLIEEQLRHAVDLMSSVAGGSAPRAWLDLAVLADECVQMAQVNHAMSITTRMIGGARAVGDPALLRRALDSMLDRACRAAGPSGTVTVRVGSDAKTSWVEVADDGLGLGSTQDGATGRGLPVVGNAVRASHGRVEIASGPGPGTTVRMLLPTQDIREIES
jgi:signal transduction histidine kinase